MTLADVCLMVSVLVVVAIVAKMLRAIRLLDGRVSVLQEQLEHSHTLQLGAASRAATSKPAAARTPIAGVPVSMPSAPVRHSPAPEDASPDPPSPGEAATHVIEQGEADAIWAQLEAEQERLKSAMGHDFRGRDRKKSASFIRGKPVARTLSAQEVAKKLERR
jgi:hypothetical protein